MKKFVLSSVWVTFFFCMIAFLNESVASATTFVCVRCGASFNDQELYTHVEGADTCPYGGKHHFYIPMSGYWNGPDTKTYQFVVGKIQGNWKSDQGDTVAIDGQYLNGCPICFVEQVAGGGGVFDTKIMIDEDKGTRQIKLTGLYPV